MDLTWPPMLTSKNTTGLTGLEFATAMAATRKQKTEAWVPANLIPRFAGLRAGAGARRNESQAPPPEVPPCPGCQELCTSCAETGRCGSTWDQDL